jgi:plastocyanin domain-containing protein
MAVNIVVAAAGLLLIALVNWYFLLSGRKGQKRR